MSVSFRLTALFFFLTCYSAFALRIETGNDIRITDPVHEDLYIFGNNIYIEAPVFGDIWCAGGTITLNDTVRGDLVVAGGNIYLRGAVLDDVRAAGGTLTVSGGIQGDLLVAGGTVDLEPNAQIGGDLFMSGGTLTVDSPVQGNVKVAGGVTTINGPIEKGLEFSGGELMLNGSVKASSTIAATRLQLGERAALFGPVRYWTEAGEVSFDNALQRGATATFDPSLRIKYERPDYRFLGFASFMGVLWYLTSALVLLLLGQWLFPKTFHRAAGIVQTDTGRSLGYGLLYLVAVPAIILLLFITVIGVPVGLIALFFYLMFFALSGIITALTAAHWVNRRQNYNWKPVKLIFAALGLLILLNIVGMIPFFGWIARALAVMVAFGAILIHAGLFERREARAITAKV